MRLLIIRNPESQLLSHMDLDAKNLKIILVQNAVYSEALRGKNALSLENDLKAAKIDLPDDKKINYDKMLDSIFEAENVLCI